MKKLMSVILIVGMFGTYANGSNFQLLQNEYNLGYQFTQMNLINGSQQRALVNQQSINVEIEHLFDMGIWVDANFNMVTKYSQPNLGPLYLNGGGGGQGGDNQAYAFGQNPFMYSLLLKGGYAFHLVNDTLQLTPYTMFGRSSNLAASTIVANGYQPAATNDFFLTGGVGIRASYRFTDKAILFADQLYSYNWDQSGAIKYIQTQPIPPGGTGYGKSYAATNYQFTTMVGARYNITKDFQVGISGFWNNYQHQSNIAGIVYIPQNTFGEMLSVGLTY